MGNLEKPLTLALAILFIVGLIIMNCECGEGKACSINGSFNFSNAGVNADAVSEIELEITTDDEALDVDSAIDSVLEGIQLEDDVDTVIEISIDLTEEEE